MYHKLNFAHVGPTSLIFIDKHTCFEQHMQKSSSQKDMPSGTKRWDNQLQASRWNGAFV